MSHDDTETRALYVAICLPAREALRAFSGDHGITDTGLIDSFAHSLTTADPTWLDGVVKGARKIDSQRRRRG